MKQTQLDKIKQAHADFTTAQVVLGKYGVWDSEPDWIYQNAVRNALFGEPMPSMNGNFFQLYSLVPGYMGANSELYRKANKVVNLILNASIKEIPAIRAWVKATCWRVDIA